MIQRTIAVAACAAWLGVMGCAGDGGADPDGGGGPDTVADVGAPDADADTGGGPDAVADADTGGGPDAVADADAAGPDVVVPPPGDYIRKSGSTARAPDQSWFAVANRDNGNITVFLLDAALDLGAASEYTLKLGEKSADVSSISAGHDGTYLLATLQYDQKVCKIVVADGPSQTPLCASTGSEPTAVVSNADGTRIYVANMVDGTVTIHGSDLLVRHTLDFSDANGETQVHPFALLYVKLEGQPGDVWVTDFFAEKVAGKQEGADDSRQGVVYRFDGTANDVSGRAKIVLPPLADTGFRLPDDNAQCVGDLTKAGCAQDPKPSGAFPNQLASLTFHEGRIYVTSTCASPRGEFRFNMNVHSCVHVIDAATDAEVAGLRMNIQERVKQQAAGADKLFCTIPTDMAFVDGTDFAYVTCAASDLVMRLDYTDAEVAADVSAGLPQAKNLPCGKFPTGINTFKNAAGSGFAFVYNENSRNVTVLDLSAQKKVADVQSWDLPAAGSKEAELLEGKDFYFTARGRWSDARWSSCAACHPRGLTDNITWHFPTGPRQTVSMDGTFSKENVTADALGNKHGFNAVVSALEGKKAFPQRMLNWTGVRDEVADFELNTRAVSGGKGAIVDASDNAIPAPFDIGNGANANNLGSSTQLVISTSSNKDWLKITEWAKTIRAPRAKTNLPGDAAAGAALFDSTYRCTSCHAGGAWTASRRYYEPVEGASLTGQLKGAFVDDFLGDKSVDPNLEATLVLLDSESSCTADADCANVAGACDVVAGKCRVRALGNELAFSLNRGIDQHACTVRDVGTFESPTAAEGALEVRKDMSIIAQGLGGFNVPSVLNTQMGAPYLHNGRYETLAAMLSGDNTHITLINKIASINATQTRDLIAYLLSIDGATATIPLADEDDACPPSFP